MWVTVFEVSVAGGARLDAAVVVRAPIAVPVAMGFRGDVDVPGVLLVVLVESPIEEGLFGEAHVAADPGAAGIGRECEPVADRRRVIAAIGAPDAVARARVEEGIGVIVGARAGRDEDAAAIEIDVEVDLIVGIHRAEISAVRDGELGVGVVDVDGAADEFKGAGGDGVDSAAGGVAGRIVGGVRVGGGEAQRERESEEERGTLHG